MIDCQLETAHLRSMGGRFIPYEEYLEILHPGALERMGEVPAINDDIDIDDPDEMDISGDEFDENSAPEGQNSSDLPF